jgi:Zn finger protein HypA/HybF involved in hydrogenase expression
MQEYQAKRKFACPACGAQAEWNPAQKALVCPYCHTISPFELPSDPLSIQELDLLSTLDTILDSQRGWQATRKSVKCSSCQAISVFDPKHVAQRCDFCGSPSIVDIEQQQQPITPNSLLPFQVSQAQVRESIRTWYGSHFWAPNCLGDQAMTDTLHGVYLPFWTFDAQANCPWQAMAGEYYYTRNSQGQSQREIRWFPASGHAHHFFDDLLIHASHGINADHLRAIAHYPTQNSLLPYDPGYLSGWTVEQYQVDLHSASEQALDQMKSHLRSLCTAQIPGDTHRDLSISPEFTQLTFKHCLLPLWILTYQYRNKTYRVLVNGYTGSIHGDHPLSFWKILIAISLALILFYIIISQQ